MGHRPHPPPRRPLSAFLEAAVVLALLLSLAGAGLVSGQQAGAGSDTNSTDSDSNTTDVETSEADDGNSTTPAPGALTAGFTYVVKSTAQFSYDSVDAFIAKEPQIIAAYKTSTGSNAVEVLSRRLVTTRRSAAARALLATAVEAEFAVGVDTPAAAQAAAAGMTASSLNVALAAAGLPAATVTVAPVITAGATGAVVALGGGGGGGSAAAGTVFGAGTIVLSPVVGQAYTFTDPLTAATLGTVVADGPVTSLSVAWATNADGSAIVYPADGATADVRSAGGFLIAGRAVDVQLELPAGAAYGVRLTLPIAFNNNGVLPSAARRAAAPPGHEFRLNADCDCPASADSATAFCSVTASGTHQVLLAASSKCEAAAPAGDGNAAVALGLGLGLGLGLPLLGGLALLAVRARNRDAARGADDKVGFLRVQHELVLDTTPAGAAPPAVGQQLYASGPTVVGQPQPQQPHEYGGAAQAYVLPTSHAGAHQPLYDV